MNTSRVLVGIPTMGAMHPKLVAALLRWASEFKEDELVFYFTYRISPVDRARNEIVRLFFEEDGGKPFTHLLLIDSDTVPPADALKRLLADEKDIVTGLTPILHWNEEARDWDVFDNAFVKVDEIGTHFAQRGTGIQPIIRCGSSCILIKRAVFEKLAKPYYEFLYNEDHTKHTKSEDINFCDKAREAGFELWADTGVVCGHEKAVML